MFFKLGILKNFTNFTGKHLCWSSFVIRLQAIRPATLLKTDSDTGIFPWYLQTFKEHSFLQKPPMVASENNDQQQLSESFAYSCHKIVQPILLQELINDFAICKHIVEQLLFEVVTNSQFWKLELQNYIFQKEPHFLTDEPRTCRILMLCCIKYIFFN